MLSLRNLLASSFAGEAVKLLPVVCVVVIKVYHFQGEFVRKNMRIFTVIIYICLTVIAAASVICITEAFVILMKKPLLKIYEKRSSEPDYCHYADMPGHLIRIITILEDEMFFEHHGFNFKEMRECVKYNWEHPGSKIGGSTITQQLCKNLYFHFEPSYWRKLCEAVITHYTEKKFSKEKILELYLNVICFDNGQYGIQAASEYYFGKKASELTFNQAYILCAMLPVVGIYNFYRVPEAFCEYKNKRARVHYAANSLEFTRREIDEIIRHNAKNLDEQLIKRDPESAAAYLRGPMINEKYGIGSEWQEKLT